MTLYWTDGRSVDAQDTWMNLAWLYSDRTILHVSFIIYQLYLLQWIEYLTRETFLSFSPLNYGLIVTGILNRNSVVVIKTMVKIHRIISWLMKENQRNENDSKEINQFIYWFQQTRASRLLILHIENLRKKSQRVHLRFNEAAISINSSRLTFPLPVLSRALIIASI